MPDDRPPGYPDTKNLDCLIDHQDQYRNIAQFLDWLLNESRYHIAEYGETEGEPYAGTRLWPARKNEEDLVCEYLGLDPKLLEAERRAVLEYVAMTQRANIPKVTMAVTIGDEKEETTLE